ncbi:CHD1 helical C-terminal domain containing protein 1 [Falco cherrug]|uniref:CHD1 helical C-terminal domain containing protein 1 n=1 Tax=Falco cherrug TaxID=345164 RepID=UPI000392DF21|nr:CHD1 helical C-terminal domain containing protein 1 [Falco cherrug]
MEEAGFKDEVDGARAKDNSRDGTAGQTTEKDLAGMTKEAAFVTGSESAPPCKTLLICCADGLDQDTFKICKDLFRPFKKSLRKLHLPQHLPTEKKKKYTKKSLTIIGDRMDLFLQQYCRASQVKHWQKGLILMLWQFVSLFSEMDGKQLQNLYKYIKNNQMDKFLANNDHEPAHTSVFLGDVAAAIHSSRSRQLQPRSTAAAGRDSSKS